jgi:hypothetical protein
MVRVTRLFAFTISTFLLALPSQQAGAEDLFMEIPIEGYKGPYLVTADGINVRAEPKPDAKVITQLGKRTIISVLGQAKGTNWFAISMKGKDLGFVYETGLSPMIDASLKEPITGSLDMSNKGKPKCSYKITYYHHTSEEEIVFISSDYQASFKCMHRKKAFKFDAMMFMSEIPFDNGTKPIFQVTLDLPDIATGYEEYLSATSLYDQDNHKVILDGVSLEAFKETDLEKERPANTIKEALIAATELHLISFNAKAWRTIAGEIKNPADQQPQ